MTEENKVLSERFDVQYIEREAAILIRYLSPRRRKIGRFVEFSLKPIDLRIMKYWGII
jgi:hypothetical protein